MMAGVVVPATITLGEQEPLLETLGGLFIMHPTYKHQTIEYNIEHPTSLSGSSRDFHPRLGRTWGMFPWVLPLVAKPQSVALSMYSKSMGRIVGTVVATAFALLGDHISTHIFTLLFD